MQQLTSLNKICPFYKGSKFVFLIILLLGLFQSCTKDNGTNKILAEEEEEQAATSSTPYVNVDAKLWPYFNRFEAEAAKRNVVVDLEAAKLVGRIQEISQEFVAGTCHFSPSHPNLVTIDKTFWETTGDKWREFVIFHELGHCYLGRDHHEGKFSNGVCASIMRSGIDGCNDNYSPNTRQYYLDELFKR